MRLYMSKEGVTEAIRVMGELIDLLDAPGIMADFQSRQMVRAIRGHFRTIAGHFNKHGQITFIDLEMKLKTPEDLQQYRRRLRLEDDNGI